MINLVTGPLIAEYWVENEMEKMKDAYQETSINGLIIGCFVFGAIWTNLENIYQFIPNSEIYIQGLNVVLFILVARLFEMACSIAPNILTQTRLYIYNLPLSLILVAMTIGLNYFLIPQYGIVGAGVATMISVLVYNVIKLSVVWFSFKLQPFKKETLYLTALFLISIFVFNYLPISSNHIVDLLIRGVAYSTFFLGIAYIMKVSRSYNDYLIGLLHKAAFLIGIRKGGDE
jgi:O-antigen/teichoic acid export membrane protein